MSRSYAPTFCEFGSVRSVSCRSPYHRPNSKVSPFEIWTDAASAENAFRSGLVTWENDPRPPNAAVDSIAIGPLRPQLPSNSQRMCLLLALRFARPSRAPAPRRPRTQQDHLPSATLFDSGFPKSWALSRQCASIPFGSSTTRCGSSQELSQRISPRPQTVEWRRAVRLNGTR